MIQYSDNIIQCYIRFYKFYEYDERPEGEGSVEEEGEAGEKPADLAAASELYIHQ